MTKTPFRHIRRFLALLLLGCAVSPSWGAEEPVGDASLFLEAPAQPAAARSPRPASKIAENVSVVTAEQIALLNAHTLADVLQTVPGVQLFKVQTPGNFTEFTINGVDHQHVLVFIDGVPQNEFIASFADVAMIPAQQIERVEIVKGAASAAWGPALGGVINVVTKSPDPERKIGGTASASYGERRTSDLRGEATGTVNRLGYYLTGGNLHSDGITPGTRINFNHFMGKLTYDLPTHGKVTLGGDYRDDFRGLLDDPGFDLRQTDAMKSAHAYLALSQPLNERFSLELLGRWLQRDDENVIGFPSDNSIFTDFTLRQESWGGNTRLLWREGDQSGVVGFEYEHDRARQREPVRNRPRAQVDRKLDRFASYLNGAFTLGPLTILPGVRFDHTALDQDNLSYTLGATLQLTDRTLLRAYGARGFGLPQINLTGNLSKIWTAQVGVESSDVPFLWLKGTLFYNDIWDIDASGTAQIHQGAELEARTVPVYDFSFSGGYTFTDARDKETDTVVDFIPRQSLKLAVNYDNKGLGLKGALVGNYAWWHSSPDFGGYYKPIIWDLHLTQKLLPASDLSPELFFSARNLFNGSQYQDNLFKNNPRWIEGGLRFRF
jgi:vitamin B12 transporter